jgi:hypothetical protein
MSCSPRVRRPHTPRPHRGGPLILARSRRPWPSSASSRGESGTHPRIPVRQRRNEVVAGGKSSRPWGSAAPWETSSLSPLRAERLRHACLHRALERQALRHTEATHRRPSWARRERPRRGIARRPGIPGGRQGRHLLPGKTLKTVEAEAADAEFESALQDLLRTDD